MKFLSLVVLTASLNTSASYYATHCSNAKGTVKWESGHNSNMMTVSYLDDLALERRIELNKLNIKLEDEIVMSESKSCSHYFFQSMKVYTAKALISPAEGYEDVLDFMGEAPKIETEVICQHVLSGRAACP